MENIYLSYFCFTSIFLLLSFHRNIVHCNQSLLSPTATSNKLNDSSVPHTDGVYYLLPVAENSSTEDLMVAREDLPDEVNPFDLLSVQTSTLSTNDDPGNLVDTTDERDSQLCAVDYVLPENDDSPDEDSEKLYSAQGKILEHIIGGPSGESDPDEIRARAYVGEEISFGVHLVLDQIPDWDATLMFSESEISNDDEGKYLNNRKADTTSDTVVNTQQPTVIDSKSSTELPVRKMAEEGKDVYYNERSTEPPVMEIVEEDQDVHDSESSTVPPVTKMVEEDQSVHDNESSTEASVTKMVEDDEGVHENENRSEHRTMKKVKEDWSVQDNESSTESPVKNLVEEDQKEFDPVSQDEYGDKRDGTVSQQAQETTFVTVKEGARLRLVCNVTGVQQYWVEWRRASNLTFPGGWQVAGGRSVLLDYVGREDAGTYTCTAHFANGSIHSTSLNISVNYAPVVGVWAQDVDEGEVELGCLVESHPSPVLAWYKNNTKISSTSCTRNIEVRSAVLTSKFYLSVIRVHNVTSADFAYYHCRALNTVGVSRGYIMIHDGSGLDMRLLELERPVKPIAPTENPRLTSFMLGMVPPLYIALYIIAYLGCYKTSVSGMGGHGRFNANLDLNE